MKTPLLNITIGSVYDVHGARVPLPERMARCTPDMKAAISSLAEDLKSKGGALILSDLFRSYDMQLGSHLDYVSGKKKAFSPPPGGSLHEAGRAFDLELESINMKLADLWPIAAAHGLVPIIDQPDPNQSEAWHFECRGSHTRVYDHYKAGKGTNFAKPYQAMAASAILSVGVKVVRFGGNQDAAYVQSALIRLGEDIGNIDGSLGPRSQDALAKLGIGAGEDLVAAVDRLLQKSFPEEFFDKAPAGGTLQFA